MTGEVSHSLFVLNGKMKNEGKMISKKRRKIWTNVIAGLLIVALVGTGVLSSMVTVTIVKSKEKTDAAVNYLVDSSPYVKENKVKRMADVLSTVGSKKTLEDYYTLASSQIASEDYRSASESISKCLEMHGPTKDDLYLDLLMKQGCIYVMLADYDKALKYLNMALDVKPGSTDVYLIEAQIYSQKKDLPSLASSLDKYLQLKPKDDEIRKLLAQTKFLEADYQGAAAEYAKILENKNDPQILYLNGLTKIQLGDFKNAETQLTEALKQNDSYEGIYYYRGVCRMSGENYAAAIEDFTASIGKKSMTQASYYSRSVCSLMTDNYNYDSVVADLNTAAAGPAPDIAKQAQELLQKLKDAKDTSQAAQEAIQNGTTDGAIQNGATGGAVTSDEALRKTTE